MQKKKLSNVQENGRGGRTAAKVRRGGLAAAWILAAGVPVSLTGCVAGVSGVTGAATNGAASIQFSGNVHGGQQPVVGATIQLYTVGTTGMKSVSTALLATPPTTDAGGNFTITGAYSCSNATQVYIVATGGNSSGGAGSPNGALSLVTALGSCANLQANAATTFIQINELTTVAAAYALAPFAQDLTHIGAAGSNPTGLVNAFATASALVNTSSGSAPGPSMAFGSVVPVSELNTLGNVLASCVNTSGSGSTPCTTLFAATGASETFGAGLGIARNPGASAITGLYTLSSGTAPFQPAYTAQPNDFTVAVTYNANAALAGPWGIAFDASGDAWITDEAGSFLNELSPTGTLLTLEPTTGLYGAQGVAIDRTGNVWVANTAGNSVIRYNLSGGVISGTSSYGPTTLPGLAGPTAIALDSAGNAFVANFNGNSVIGLTGSGTPLANSPFTGSNGNIQRPSSLALDTTGNIYVASGNGSVVKLSNAGVYASTLTDNTLQGPLGVALDPANHVFLSGSTTGTAVAGAVSEFSAAGTPANSSPVQSGVVNPFGMATDGTSVWIANSTASGSLTQLAYGSPTPVSPAAGFGSLNTPIGVAVDRSGNVWTTNSGSNTVSKFVGLAVPVATPLAANVGP